MLRYHNDRFMKVSEIQKVLTLVWKKETSDLTDESFKKEALKFIDMVKKSKVKNILVDMREFQYKFSDDLLTWRNEQVISVYNKLGIEKFAFVSEKITVKQDNSTNKFVTRYFLTEKEAENWLRS